MIGGEAPGDGNLIAYNGFTGVRAVSGQNTVLGNGIHSHGDLGIDMALGGPTPNDDGADDGVMNHPLITAADPVAGGLRVQGTLHSDPATTLRIELFSSTDCDLSGHGRGRAVPRLRERDDRRRRQRDFDVVMPGPVLRFDASALSTTEGATGVLGASLDHAQEPIVTATATDAITDYTSEFSPCATSSGPRAPSCGSSPAGPRSSAPTSPTCTSLRSPFAALTRTFELPTLQDALVEGPETFTVALAEPFGGHARRARRPPS